MTVLNLGGQGMTLTEAVEALRDIGADPAMRHSRDGSEYWQHRCAHPDHHDSWPSATIAEGRDGALLLNCFSCAPADQSSRRRWVAQCVGRLMQRTPKDPPTGGRKRTGGSTGAGGHGVKVAHYDYTDHGAIEARKVRFHDEHTGRKSFLWQRPYGATGWVDGLNGRPLRELPLYGVDSITEDGAVIYVVEGEKDADRLHSLGKSAVSAAGSNPSDIPDDLSALAGRSVIIVADRDLVGGRLALAWRDRLDGVASVALLAQPRVNDLKADISDHLDAGYTLADLDFGPVTPPPEPSPDDDSAESDLGDEDVELEPSSWLPVDLHSILTGDYVRETAAILIRSDGQALVYRGRISSMYGESESGKTWVALITCAQVLTDGGTVAYIDFESDAATIVARLRALGVTDFDGLIYLHPERRPTHPADLDAWDALMGMRLDLAVIDGVTEALVMWGGASKDNDDITAWAGAFPKQLARSTGAGVITIDHVTKSADTRGRFAIGGQAKLATLDGVGYLVEPEQVLAPGKVGVLHVRVAKDRPGDVRANSGLWRATDRTQLTAVITFDATEPTTIRTVIDPPDLRPLDEREPFRPSGLMEKVSRYLEDTGDASMNALETAIGGKRDYLRAAVDALESEGYVRRFVGNRNARMVQLVADYRESLDEILAAAPATRPGVTT